MIKSINKTSIIAPLDDPQLVMIIPPFLKAFKVFYGKIGKCVLISAIFIA